MGAAQQFPIAEMMAQAPRLVSLPGQASREHRITGAGSLIGSDGQADFVLMDPSVSRRHATITKKRGRYFVTDLKSRNGTRVNGKPVTPDTDYPIGGADDIQFGALHFTFLLPEGAHDSMRGALQRRMRIEAIVTVLLLVSIVLSYIIPKEFWTSLIPHRTPRVAMLVMPDTWLTRLNSYRQSAGLTAVNEVTELSKGDANHAHYLVANKAAMIRGGGIDASIHEEEPGKPFFTPEGRSAGALSDIDAVYTDPPEASQSPWAIENWMTGPFHRMWLLNPALHQVGYGQFCEKGICAAALNVHSGVDAEGDMTAPVMYPPDRSTIRDGTFSAEEAEWPDPLATCGYHTPTGVPITLQIGGHAPAGLEEFSLTRNGKPVEACAFDATSYRSKDPIALERVRKQLAQFAAIVMVPKEPLVPGAMYTVKMVAAGQSFSWWFAVEP